MSKINLFSFEETFLSPTEALGHLNPHTALETRPIPINSK